MAQIIFKAIYGGHDNHRDYLRHGLRHPVWLANAWRYVFMNVGSKVLLSVDNWFYAPDGLSYRAAWGTIKGIRQDCEVLGLKTNARSTNWYIEIGNMIVAGCQIHYALECEKQSFGAYLDDDGKEKPSRTYNADRLA